MNMCVLFQDIVCTFMFFTKMFT